ncbi:UbiA prenyltransferase family-domain-containing protein [Xylaria bambusicola]|uniref:UbiA prenyltransferase family-domain-containing protein n=1 Tax=Xylaria bambusicola TaxID=326684 RepID=UPI00200883BB|nr:UbiA prenyltransferase family-domain-containing protein [Xylaria bambusicola]KAI0508721.1 UbiA prenyltransferase family-domain-containing protein [Xylaria bambusicola]
MTHSNKSAPVPQEKENTRNAFARQYGGIHSGTWVDLFPSSCIPYIQLSRLSPPVAFFLIYLPHLFGVAHAAKVHNTPIEEVIRTSVILLGGSFFCNNASHAWNDLIDASIDKVIPRTQNRPIPRGAISPRAALVFTGFQVLGAVSFLLVLPASAVKASIPTILITTYYPFAKRHTHLAQFCLFLAAVVWVVIFDTVYAHQDLPADLEVGVKSMAVLIKGRAKLVLWLFWACLGGFLGCSGYFGGMGLRYYAISMGGCIALSGIVILRVDLEDPRSCWKWFSSGFWLTGTSIAAGMLAEYLAELYYAARV